VKPPDVLLPKYKVAPSPDLSHVAPDGFNCKTTLDTGFRALYCSVRNVISFRKIEAISGLHMFVSGPHNQKQELNFSDPVEFGHYNPKFLDWVDDHIIPITDDDLPFKNAVRPVYTA
jgi:hypothetical protein